jgi:hypothetical protein
LANSIEQNTQCGGKKGTKKEDKFKTPKQNSKCITKGHWNKSCSKILTNLKKHIKKRKGMGNLNWQAFNCNDNMLQDRGGLSSLQSYQHLLPIENTQSN